MVGCMQDLKVDTKTGKVLTKAGGGEGDSGSGGAADVTDETLMA